MTLNHIVETKKAYVPFDKKYSTKSNSTIDGFVETKSDNIKDKVVSLYQELYKRKEINTKLIEEIEHEIIETSSELYQHKYTSFLDSRQKSALESKLSLLSKTKWSEVTEYWRDCSRLKMYLLNSVAEYREFKNKKDLLK